MQDLSSTEVVRKSIPLKLKKPKLKLKGSKSSKSKKEKKASSASEHKDAPEGNFIVSRCWTHHVEVTHALSVLGCKHFHLFINAFTFIVPLRCAQSTRSSTCLCLFQISLPDPWPLPHKSSFIPRACNLWSILPSSFFSTSSNLSSFNHK